MSIDDLIDDLLKDKDMQSFNGKEPKVAKKSTSFKRLKTTKEIQEIIKKSDELFVELKKYETSNFRNNKDINELVPIICHVFNSYTMPESLFFIFELGRAYERREKEK